MPWNGSSAFEPGQADSRQRAGLCDNTRTDPNRCDIMTATPNRQIISTKHAPAAIGPYSQAVHAGDTVYVSGQIPLDPATGELVAGDIEAQIERVFDNLDAVARAAGGTLAHVVRFTIYLTDMDNFASVNKVMESRLEAPYPARAAIGVAALPKGAQVEADAILALV